MSKIQCLKTTFLIWSLVQILCIYPYLCETEHANLMQINDNKSNLSYFFKDVFFYHHLHHSTNLYAFDTHKLYEAICENLDVDRTGLTGYWTDSDSDKKDLFPMNILFRKLMLYYIHIEFVRRRRLLQICY